MKTTVKLVNIACNKQDLKQLEELMEKMGLTKTEIIKRALTYYYEQKICDREALIAQQQEQQRKMAKDEETYAYISGLRNLK